MNSVRKRWARAVVVACVTAVALVLVCLAPQEMQAGLCTWGAEGGKR
jgi:hypothetical protein